MLAILRLSAVAFLLVWSAAAPASIITYIANLDGPSESPPNASPGTGFARVDIDDIANTLGVQVSFSDLLGTTTVSHIHCCTAAPFTGTAGVATVTPSFTGFPAGVTNGTYSHTFDLLAATGTWNPAFVTAHGGTPASAAAFFLTGLSNGEAYFNIHSSFATGGEIRGFLVAAVPEPGTLALLLLGAAGAFAGARRRERR